MRYLTRYRDLATQIKGTKEHKTEAGRARWIARQSAAGRIRVVDTYEMASA